MKANIKTQHLDSFNIINDGSENEAAGSMGKHGRSTGFSGQAAIVSREDQVGTHVCT